MQLKMRIALLALLAFAALALSSCKETAPNSNQSNANRGAVRPARWVAQYRAPLSEMANIAVLEPFYTSISVISPNVVYVAGDMKNPRNTNERIGVVARTTDGGATWANIPLESSGQKLEVINSLHFIDQDRGWVAGHDYVGDVFVLRTIDGGATWTGAKVNFKQAVHTIFFTDPNNGWMGGSTPISEDEEEGGASSLLQTTDGGASWQMARRLSTSLSDIFFVDQTTGWATGHKGAIYHTTDGGISWDSQKSELELPEGPVNLQSRGAKKFKIRGVHFINPQTGFAPATSDEDKQGILLATNDGGAVWSTKWIVADSGAFDAVLTSPTEGWACTKNGRYIYHTVDGGQSWLSEPIDFDQEVAIYRLAAADAAHVWAVGQGAVFFRVLTQ